jgi:hypothetical protein
MPPYPAKLRDMSPVNISVEFLDYGTAKTVRIDLAGSVLDAIQAAAKEYEIEDYTIEVVRNAGAEVPLSRDISQLEDEKQLIVYLKCAPRKNLGALIVRLQACEDLFADQIEVRVEVPETDDVFTVHVRKVDNITTVIEKTPIPLVTISKITYNGARIELWHTLDYLHFANKSALIVYMIPMPLPITSPSSSPSPSPHPNFPQFPASDLLNNSSRPALPPIPVPVTEPEDWPRPEMSAPADVRIHFESYPHLDFPMRIFPTDTGLAILEALRDRTGRPFTAFTIGYRRLPIEFNTPLSPFGFVDDDVIPVQLHPRRSQ